MVPATCGPCPDRTPTAGGRRLRRAAGVVRREPRSDRRASALLRPGQRLQLLHDAERGHDVVRQAGSTRRTQAPRSASRSLCSSSAATRGRAQGAEQATGVVNDLRGDRSEHSGTPSIPQYSDVVYHDLWPNIDLRLREQSGVLKYEFHVQPGASPSDIHLAYRGAEGSRSATAAGCRSRPARRAGGLGARVVPGHRRRPGARGKPLRAGRRRRREWSVLVRRRWLPDRPRTDHRPGRAVHDVPRRQHRRDRATASRSTRPATHSSPVPRSRPTSRPPPAHSIAPVRPRTSPTCS